MGLKEEEVIKNREKYGSNSLQKIKKNTFISLLLDALADPIIKILLLALVIKTVLMFSSFDWFETIGILVAVLLATLISSLSEYGSENAFSKLQENNSKIKSKVIRSNKLSEIFIDDIVVNDIVVLSSGDKVPADGILIEGSLSVDESPLNGESKEVYKKRTLNKKNPLKENIVLRGSVVYSGDAKVLITKVGDNTLYGSISKELQEKTPDSPLKQRLKLLASSISKMGYVGALLVAVTYLFQNIVVNNNYDIELIMNTLTNFSEMADHIMFALTTAVTIIVVAVPEGLPMMITLVLASNMKKMLKDKVLVRKMVGVETAGSMNLLLTDKTGTLTKGKLKVLEFINSEGIKYKDFKNVLNSTYKKTIKNLLLCNNESVLSDGKIIGGNSTDKAILEFVKEEICDYKILERKSFNSITKISEVTINDEYKTTYIKGASEVILPKCTTYINMSGKVMKLLNKKNIHKDLNSLTAKGSRVIVLAKKIGEEYSYLGMISIKDDLREEAIEGIKKIKNAGIHTIMITGDAKETAEVIAKEVGITLSVNDKILTSDEFNNLSDEEIMLDLQNIKVIARALPSDKSRLVKIGQKKNLIVGMTGDGVNDAPALKKANVGFAMGSGMEVAKEAAEIVILDNNILSISKAVLYGRTVFKSIRKFIVYQLSINVCALIISVVGTLLGIHEPITIIQMLWLNMIMDTFAGLAFSFEPALDEYMEEKPKEKDIPIMNKYMLSEVIVSGFFTSILCLLFLKVDIVKEFFRLGENNMYLYTAYFALFIFLGVFNAFNARTERINVFANITKNKIFIIVFSFIIIVQIYIIYYGGTVFRTYGLSIYELITVIALALLVLPVDFIRKILLKKKGKKTGF